MRKLEMGFSLIHEVNLEDKLTWWKTFAQIRNGI